MKRNRIPRYGGLKKGDFDLLFHLSSTHQALCSSEISLLASEKSID